MSTDRPAPRRLADWMGELVELAGFDPFGAGARLRGVVGARRARIALDDEVVEVSWRAGRLEIGRPQPAVPADGTGATTSEVVRALLEGRMEVSSALHDGLIQATGNRDAVSRIFAAIEILLDASTRVPGMRLLADDFLRQHGGPSAADAVPPEAVPGPGTPMETSARRGVHVGAVADDERELLERLGLGGAG